MRTAGDWRIQHREEASHLQHLERKWNGGQNERDSLTPAEIRELEFSPKPGIAAWAADYRQGKDVTHV